MAEEPILQISTEADDCYNLEIKKKDFKDFLEGMLGDRRQLKKRIPLGFEANLADILNLHQRIYQRTFSQNISVVDTFSCKFFFEDRTEKTINDRYAFEAINETSRISLRRMVLTYSFLLQFTGRPYPEKQEIKVDLDTKRKFESARRYNSELTMSNDEWPCMTIEVDYTNISWGEDLLSLIEKFCSDRFYAKQRSGLTDSKLAFLTVSWAGIIANGIFFLFCILSYKGNIVIARHAKIIASEGNQVLGRLNALLVDERSISLSWGDYIGLLWNSVPLLSFVIMTILLGSIQNKSHIILNEAMRDDLKEEKKKNDLLYMGVIISFLLSVVAGITANYLPVAIFKIIGRDL